VEPALAGRDKQGVGGGDRQAAIRKGTDARQAVIRRTRQRGASEHESESEEEAEGSHLTVSGFLLPALPAVFVVKLVTNRCFRTSAPKAENGFVARKNCFVDQGERNNWLKNQVISIGYDLDVSPPGSASRLQSRPKIEDFAPKPLVH
jgi:hypothetical protein